MRPLTSFLFFMTAIVAYGQDPGYKPRHLTRLSDEALLESARKRVPLVDMGKVAIKDSLGREITKEQAANFDVNKYTYDFYVDKNGLVVEGVIRRMTQADHEFRAKLGEAFEEGVPIVPVDVNCAEVKSLLEEMLRLDQEDRNQGNINADTDYANQSKLISLIEKCGWPTKAEVGSDGMQAVFLVLQHASKKLRAKYFPMIKASAEKGDMELSAVALMEDRMLMENGHKQKYGSQLRQAEDGTLTLYPIEDPAHLNERRAAMGLGTIETYLKHFGLEYKPEEN